MWIRNKKNAIYSIESKNWWKSEVFDKIFSSFKSFFCWYPFIFVSIGWLFDILLLQFLYFLLLNVFLNFVKRILDHVPHNRLSFGCFLNFHLLDQLHFLILQPFQFLLSNLRFVFWFRLFFDVFSVLVWFVFLFAFCDTLVDMGLIEYLVVEVDLSLNFGIELFILCVRALLIISKLVFYLLVVTLLSLVIMLEDSLLPVVFNLVKLSSTLL